MSESAILFWTWFRGFAAQLPRGSVPESMQNDLLAELQKFDERLYFLMSTGTSPRELMITADGNKDAFSSADILVGASLPLEGWLFIALKPALGFDFQHTNGPISLNVNQLWFMPTKSKANPSELGLVVAFPNADFVLHHQLIDTAPTILESAIGERAFSNDIAHVAVADLPSSPEDNGFLELPQLTDYIAFHKRRCDE